MLFVLLTSLLDDVGPTMLQRVGASASVAVHCLVLAYGDELTRYLPLGRYARRVEGSTGPHAIDWYPALLAEIETPERRFASIRDRVEVLFAVGGFRDYESALEQLAVRGSRTG